jgi:hypothetical protein
MQGRLFRVKFPEEYFHSIDRLQEALEFQERVKKTYAWDTENIAALHRLDSLVTRAIDFWVNTTLEGYIIEFAVENHQSFSLAKVHFKKYARGRLLR